MSTRTIVVASEGTGGLDGFVSGHFGHCESFTVVRTEDGRVLDARVVENPSNVEHRPGVVPNLVRQLGANAVIAGGMGPVAVAAFEHHGIAVVTGARGRIADAVSAFLGGTLQGSAPCEEGGSGGGGHHARRGQHRMRHAGAVSDRPHGLGRQHRHGKRHGCR